ncbi:AI-2E family transporter [Piscinibacter sp.]|uniref:AI-2E family transporter n=1 Tax=Piscinibacter sp. TaxID=1903157 RepID=UPI002D06A8A0|nr:AI-2E family transporter [Albitalea sp.]HUG25648.1 AI-2E family transporter [Albitalea sp.]
MTTEQRDASGDAQPEPTLHAPVDVRSVSLVVLAVLATVFTLHWASVVLIPVMVGVMFSYALSPIVERLVRWRVPRAISAAILIVGLLASVVGLMYSLADDANELIESLPKATQKLRQVMRSGNQAPSPMDKVQKAATQLEQAAEESGPRSSSPRGATRVVIERPRFNIKDYLWTGTLGLITLIGQVTIVSFLVFFILASGDTFRRKMVAIAGPTFAQKKVTVQVLDDITRQIERYLLVQVFTSSLVGLVTWLVFLWMGVEHAAVWGVLAGVLNFIPYIGAVLVTGGAAMVGFLQFGTVEMALAIGGASLVIQTLEGYLLTPWLTSRASKMSPVVIFVGVLAWGWLWGAWGLILGVPILMTVKAVCDRVEDLRPIGELLGD